MNQSVLFNMYRTPNGYMEQMTFVDIFKTLNVHSVYQSTGTAFKKHTPVKILY